MRRVLVSILAGAGLLLLLGAAKSGDRSKTYDVTGQIIEACSCPLFCTCYFNTEPNDPHMCEFNNVYKFAKGSHYGMTDLSEVKVWLSGDLGGEAMSKGKAKQAIITFQKGTTDAQKDAIGKLVGVIYPVTWDKSAMREDDIEWHHDNGNDHAKMGSGMGEVTLKRGNWEATKMPAVLKGVKYFGADSNDGFVLARSTHYFHGDDLKFDLEERNGFFITIHKHGNIEAPKTQAGGR
jgi:hypothetical protein